MILRGQMSLSLTENSQCLPKIVSSLSQSIMISKLATGFGGRGNSIHFKLIGDELL